MTRGVAVDLFVVANQVGRQNGATEYKNLAGEVSFPGDGIIVDDRMSHQVFC